MAKTLDQNSEYSVVRLLCLSLCVYFYSLIPVITVYFRWFLSTILRKVMFLGHLVSLFDILGGAGKVQGFFS